MKQVDIKNLSYAFGNSIFRHTDFSAEEGELVVISGPSGIGKSTMLNIIGLLIHLQDVAYTLFGQQVSQLSEQQRAHLRNQNIGFVFQSLHLIEHYSMIQNVLLPTEYTTRPVYKEKEAISLLERCGLSDHTQHVAQLSYGQQQRVAIARALILNPKLIIADEPTSALDQDTAQNVIQILTDATHNGATTIISTHDPKIIKCANKHYQISEQQLILT